MTGNKWKSGRSLLNDRLAKMVFVATVLATSCTKDINLTLPNAGPQIVIEGNITDQPGPYTVNISTSTPYSSNVFPSVTHAIVVVSDNAGNTDTLVETDPGIYQTHPAFQGVPGRTYTMKVLNQGTEYDAVSTMPPAVAIDTLGVKTITIVGFSRTAIYCEFKDPVNGITNYYRISTYQYLPSYSGYVTADRAYSDQFTNGSEEIINVATYSAVGSGDSIVVVLQTIDEPVYTYFNTLRNNTNGSNAAPANPISNITNNALGYFSACGLRSKSIVVP